MSSRIPPRGARWFIVPAGTEPANCRGLAKGGTCNQRVYWVRSAAGLVPVDCDIAGGLHPTLATNTAQGDLFLSVTPVHPGKGISHNEECPDRMLFAFEQGAPLRRRNVS
jgi:hypothetical protein